MRKANETALVRALLEYLNALGIPAWRNNVGAMKGEHKGKSWFVRFGPKGASDIFAIVPPAGRFLAVEAKMLPNRPTTDQQAFLANVRVAGGLGLLCYSVKDLEEGLREEGVIP